LASLDILQGAESKKKRRGLEKQLRDELQTLWSLAAVGDVRQEGLVAGVELVADWRTRTAFPLKARAGIRVCEAMARRGVLTRPIGNVIPLLPPYCTTQLQLRKMVRVLRESIADVVGGAGC
jgi:adenosylmethionine-8-amino-7-oxononanoate aminotransferase